MGVYADSSFLVSCDLVDANTSQAAASAIDDDLRSGRLVRTSLRWSDVLRSASQLSTRHAATTGTRSLDILHIASAKALKLKILSTSSSAVRLPHTA